MSQETASRWGLREGTYSVPFSDDVIEAFVSRLEGTGTHTMGEVGVVLEYITSDDGWRMCIEVDSDCTDRERAYERLGRYLRRSRRFFWWRDWIGFRRETVEGSQEEENALDLPHMSTITGILYSIRRYASYHHWEALSTFVPTGYLEKPRLVYERLLSHAKEIGGSSAAVREAMMNETGTHLRLWEETPPTSSRSRIADMLAGCSHRGATYRGTTILCSDHGLLTWVSEPLFCSRPSPIGLVTNLQECYVQRGVQHIIETMDLTSVTTSCLAPLFGLTVDDNVDSIFEEVTGMTIHGVILELIEDVLLRESWPSLVRTRFGPLVTGSLCRLLQRWIKKQTHGDDTVTRAKESLSRLMGPL